MDEWCIATCHSPAPFCLLESFSIIAQNDSLDPYHWNWEGFSSELRDAISNNILSSALKTLSLTGNTVPITFFLRTLHLQTLELHYVNLCLANRFWGRELKLAYTGGFEGSGTSQWLTGVCGICHITQSYICAQYEISFICVFLTNSGQKGLTNSKFLPFMCSIRFLLSSILNP